MQLNPKQAEAKNKIDWPLLIIAGAGSWKTATLTARVEYMIREKGINPNSIMMVTFTNKAANEMRERVAKTLWVETPRNIYARWNFPLIWTFHSIWIFMLKEVLANFLAEELNIWLKKDFVIYDETDKLSVLKSILKNRLQIDEKEFPARQIAFYISNAKNSLITAKWYEKEVDSSIKEVVHKAYSEYEKDLIRNNAIDFDDILVKTLALLKIPRILEIYQERYKYLMIDEYQDTNAPQYEIVKALATKYRNLAVVGDDYQCLTWDTKINIEWSKVKNLEEIKIWDKILSYDWSIKDKYYPVESIYKNNINDYIYTIHTSNWNKIKASSKHIFFSNPEDNFKDGSDYGVYLMYKHNVWYRIWFTRFKWLWKNWHNIYWLRKRLNWEQADKARILHTTNSGKEAKYYEQYYSFKYSIPQTVFTAKWKLTELDQEDVDRIFENIDTHKNAEKLLNDLNINKQYPQVIASASNRFKTLRVNVNFLMMWWNEKNRRFWVYRVTLHTSHKIVIDLLQLHFPDLCRKAKLWIRIDKELADYEKIFNLTKDIYNVLLKAWINTEIIERLSYTNKSYSFLPASNLQVWFWITTWNWKSWKVEKITKISKEKINTTVYDLDIAKTHNFVANNILTHNSIYSWRGADMRNIINFKKDYPEALIVKLEQNYRSTKKIIAWANAVIANNTTGMKKELWTDNDAWEHINYIEAPDDKTEASIVVNIIKEKEWDYKDNLILYRTNAQSRKLEEALMIANIPYRVIWWQKFYDRKEIKDLLAYLRVIHNNNDVVSMKRIINTPTRKIWPKSIEILDNYRENFWLSYPQIIENIDEVEELKAWAKNAINNFWTIFNSLVESSNKLVVPELIREVVKQTNYNEYLTEWLSKEEKEAKLENIDELVNVATEYNGMEPRESLATFLEEIALITDMDKWDERPDYVTLMTIHTSKWLEEKRVFLTWLEDGIFPSFRSTWEQALLEEERRLMYVAMTRAREELYISRAKERFNFWDYVRNPESRFLKEIPLEYLVNYDLWEYLKNSPSPFGSMWWSSFWKIQEHPLKHDPNAKLVKTISNNDVSQFNRWDKINHPKFGNWIITSLNWELAEIAFSWKWIKKMNIRIAPVRKL